MDTFFEMVQSIPSCQISDMVALESAEIKADKALLMYDSARTLQNLNDMNAELRWFSESGDPDTLIAYYEAAKNSETEQKSEGLLKRAWRAIKEIFQKIKNTLFKKSQKPIDPKQKVNVPKPFAFICSKLKGAWNAVKGTVISGKQKLSENGNWKKLLIVLGATATAAGASAIAYNKSKAGKSTETVEMTAQDVQKTKDVLEEMTDTLGKVAENAEENPSAQDPENAKAIKEVTYAIRRMTVGANTFLYREAVGDDGDSDKAAIISAIEKIPAAQKVNLIRKGIRRTDKNAWDTEYKEKFKANSLDHDAASTKIKELLGIGKLTLEEIAAVESAEDEDMSDVDTFMESVFADFDQIF